MITMPIELYTDGSCSHNPGAGGYGYVIRYWDASNDSELPVPKTIEVNQGFRLTTNNRMEILAGIVGLRHIIDKINDNSFEGATQINLASDSEYFCKAINQNWIVRWASNNWMTSSFGGKQPTPVKNKDLWEQVLQVQDELHKMGVTLTITHVKGHADNEWNIVADKLATGATANTNNHLIDEIYEKTMTVYNRR